MYFNSLQFFRIPHIPFLDRSFQPSTMNTAAFRRTFHSKFKIHVLPRCAQSFICRQLSAIWNDQCFTSTRSARGRSLIKLLKDFRRRPRDAVPHCDSWIQDELPVLPCALSRSLSRPSYSFCRPTTQHPTPCILLELHSQFPPCPSSR